MSGEDKARPRADVLREQEANFPVSGLNTALLQLRRPFSSAAVRWKVQSAGDGWGIVIAYIDARLVIERLNLVVGYAWEDEYKPYSEGIEECALSVCGITRRDVGEGRGPQAGKGRRSDSLKRAGVKFGIGVSVYALKSVMMDATPAKDATQKAMLTHNKESGGQGKKYWSARLSPRAEAWLTDMYERWLEARGVELFGPVLDHGDESGAQGLEADEAPRVEAPSVGEPTAPAALDDERAEDARNRVRAAYGAMRKLGTGIKPGENRAALQEANGSHEALEELADKREAELRELLAKKGES